jgi:hypothetical protein
MIVYLDSQDFSRMADPPPGKEAFYSDLEMELVSLVENNTIEIRYSAIHISEMSHTSAGATQFSARRADVLKRLSRGKCLRFWQDLLDQEIQKTFSQSADVVATAENNHWFEIDLSGLSDFVDLWKEEMHESLKAKGVNRKNRRVVAAKFDFVGYLTQRPEGIALLDNMVSEINSKYPLEKDIDRDALISYVSGSLNKKRFLDYMGSLMADPVNLIARLAPQYDQSFKLPSLARNPGQTLVNKINPALESLASFLAQLPSGPVFQELKKTFPASINQAMLKVRRTIVQQRLLEIDKRKAHKLGEAAFDKVRVPSLDVIVAAMEKILLDNVSAAQNANRLRFLKPSDGADLLHAAYIPYVRFFRCDRAWIENLKPQAKEYGTAVIGKIELLLPAIKAQLVT